MKKVRFHPFLTESAGCWKPRRKRSPKNTREPLPEPVCAAVGADVRRSLSRQCFQRGERTKVTGVLRMPVI